MITINFYIECFDRYLNVTVREDEETRAREIINSAYNLWISEPEEVEGECCEEYICNKLKENYVEFTFSYEISDEDKVDYLKQLLHEEECKSAGFCQGCDEYDENQGKIEALRWAIEKLAE
jgi:hypothetical protein